MIYSHQNIEKNLEETCDVCVVGSGAGGAVVAKELAEVGLKVILVEEGGYYQTSDFREDEVLPKVAKLYRNGGTTSTWGKPPVNFTEGSCVGGSTTVNGGMCWRTPQKILKKWQWEYGLTDLTNRKLDPLFERVEEIISVKSILPESMNNDSKILRRGAEKLGYAIKENVRAHDHCVGMNQCVTGCPTGAKQSTLLSYIPRFLEAGGTLIANCRIKKVKHSGKRITGVFGHIHDPETKQKKHKVKIKAKVTVLSGGAIQTPLLLLKSGIKSKSKLTGENLILHPNIKVVGVFDEPVNAWQGVNQAYQVTEFLDEGILIAINFIAPSFMGHALPVYGDGFLSQLKDIYNHCITGAALIEDTTRGSVRPRRHDDVEIKYDLNETDFKLCLRAMAVLSEIYFAAGAKKVFLPIPHPQEIHTVDEIYKIFEQSLKPSDLELMTVHLMGTCQMGRDENSGVVNSFGEHYGTKGLFIADASVFPTSIGVNPQVTIMALATRTANHIAENMSRFQN